jgi:opacity protein-like surface antigen
MNASVKRAVWPLCAAVFAATPAMAQTSSSGASFVPYTSSGYVGLNIGKPDYKLPCTVGFNCDDPNTSFHIYTGGSMNQWLGAEVGYLYLGRSDRQGGTTRGQGLNLSLVGTVPVAQSVKLFGKIGATWGRTTVSANPLSGEPTGDKNSLGPSYGLGAQYDISNSWAAVLQWDRNSMKFAGRGREDIDATSLGIKYKF